jgi:hypothetical protein
VLRDLLLTRPPARPLLLPVLIQAAVAAGTPPSPCPARAHVSDAAPDEATRTRALALATGDIALRPALSARLEELAVADALSLRGDDVDEEAAARHLRLLVEMCSRSQPLLLRCVACPSGDGDGGALRPLRTGCLRFTARSGLRPSARCTSCPTTCCAACRTPTGWSPWCRGWRAAASRSCCTACTR